MNDMGFWDYLTLSVALGVIVIYIGVRIRRLLSSNSSGCSCHLKPTGCSQDSADNCHTKPAAKESKVEWTERK
ncbi:MAG: hypothetical protein OEL79_02050 [Chromatiales bacterium]|nr:hypothetical protein [Chromatiales bacterium]